MDSDSQERRVGATKEARSVNLDRRRTLAAFGGLSVATAVSYLSAVLGNSNVYEQGRQDGVQIGVPTHGTGLEKARTAPLFTVKPDQLDPARFLADFDYGKVSRLPDGRILREFELTAVDRTIEVAPGVYFPAWTYNSQVPGPTLRCTEGDLVKVHFRNAASHHHTIHFHGFHPANMDGVFEQIALGETYIYEFTAEPFGVHLYHCHTMPVSKHIAKGLYGAFIVDPKNPRPPAREMVMVMNGFDVNFDEENEFYTVNGVANYYMDHPIRIRVGELIRIYLVNITEFDLMNSFHTHATFFRYYPTGTNPTNYQFTDTIILGQGERGIMEFSYKWPGRYLFHAHKNEFAERGWIGVFQVEG